MSHRAAVGITLLLVGELALRWRYGAYGAGFHFWLHGLIGAGLGLSAVGAAGALGRPGGLRRPVAWAALGHTVSALPDVLFLAADILHVPWMDVLALHITVHFLPAPLVTAAAVFTLGAASAAAARLDRRRVAGALLGATAVVLAAGLALRTPLPRTLEEVCEVSEDALVCTAQAEEEAVAAFAGTRSAVAGPPWCPLPA